MGPILEAIDEGHIEKNNLCLSDRRTWPCPTMREARKAQVQYADNLRLQNDMGVQKATRLYV